MFDFTIYRQKCRECQRWGTTKLVPSEMERVAQNFSDFMVRILTDTKRGGKGRGTN